MGSSQIHTPWPQEVSCDVEVTSIKSSLLVLKVSNISILKKIKFLPGSYKAENSEEKHHFLSNPSQKLLV